MADSFYSNWWKQKGDGLLGFPAIPDAGAVQADYHPDQRPTVFDTGGTAANPWTYTPGLGAADFSKASVTDNPADPSVPGNTSKPSITGNPPDGGTPATSATSATPAPAASAFGYNYGTDANYNPWALYNGGTQDGGWYNAQADSQHWDNGRGGENSRDRLWRWTLDDLRNQGYTDPGHAPLGVVQKVFANNISRLHRDFDANHLDWHTSGFANFDKLDAAHPAGAPGPATGPGTSPPVPPGSNPAPAGQQPDPNAPAPSVYTDPITGKQHTVQGGNGYTAAQNLGLSTDADLAYRQMLKGLGLNPDSHGLFANFIQSKFSDLLHAYTQQAGAVNPNAVDNIGGLISSFGQGMFQPGGHFFGDLRASAAQNLASGAGMLGDINQSDAIKWLQQNAKLAYAGSGDLLANAQAQRLQDAANQYGDYSFATEGAGQKSQMFYDWLNNGPGNKYSGIFNYR